MKWKGAPVHNSLGYLLRFTRNLKDSFCVWLQHTLSPSLKELGQNLMNNQEFQYLFSGSCTLQQWWLMLQLAAIQQSWRREVMPLLSGPGNSQKQWEALSISCYSVGPGVRWRSLGSDSQGSGWKTITERKETKKYQIRFLLAALSKNSESSDYVSCERVRSHFQLRRVKLLNYLYFTSCTMLGWTFSRAGPKRARLTHDDPPRPHQASVCWLCRRPEREGPFKMFLFVQLNFCSF